MGVSGISIWQIGIVLILIILLFGSKRLKNLGGEIGKAIKELRKNIDENKKDND